MTALNLFIPITKIDSAKRIVYGKLTQAVPDKSNEIIDYPSTKAAYQKWSDEAFERSQGKSKGNLRAMHGNIAAGKFTDIVFDDDNQAIEGCAYVTDDNEWKKCENGTYTGFSHGGDYAKRWKDPDRPHLTRYTPELAEVSLVDNPCLAAATFEFIKQDGSTELRKFNQPHEAPMTDTITDEQKSAERPQDKGGVVQGFMAKDGSFHLKKADALKHNDEADALAAAAPALEAMARLDEALAKGAKKDKKEETAEDDKADEEKAEKAEKEEADKSEKADEPETDEPDDDEAEEEKENPKGKKPRGKKADGEKAAAGGMKKGLYGVSCLANLLQQLDYLQECSGREEADEGDDSAIPEKLAEAVKALGDILKAMTDEEVDELIGNDEKGAEPLFMAAGNGGLAKAGARHGKADMERVQKLHDEAHEMHECMGDMVEKCAEMHKSAGDMKNTAIDLGAEGDKVSEDGAESHTGKDAEKAVASGLTKMTAENAALRKALGELTPKISDMLKRVEDQNALMADQAARIDHLERQPMPAKGAIRPVEKGAAAASDDDVLALLKNKSKDEVGMLLMKAALATPSRIIE